MAVECPTSSSCFSSACPSRCSSCWRRLNPALEAVDPRLLPLAVAGLVLAMAAAIWLGLSRETGPGSVYVPAELSPDGTIRPGHLDPRP